MKQIIIRVKKSFLLIKLEGHILGLSPRLLTIDLFDNKKPVKIAFDGFEYKGNVIRYANKSSTIEGNKPSAIFNTIDTTATI